MVILLQIHKNLSLCLIGARAAQSNMATRLRVEKSEFDPRRGQGRDFPLRPRVQTGSDASPASYPMGTGGSFPWDKAAGA